MADRGAERGAERGAKRRGGLVKRLLNNPSLPAYVANMRAPVLHNLITHIGKEDAQELMVLASPEQMRELIALDVWADDGPGTAEQFDPAKLLEWLELWRDMDAKFLVQKLAEVGSELFSAALLDYVVVVDLDTVGVQGDVDVFGRYGVLPEDHNHWPIIFELLAEIWSEDPDLLLDVLGRVCVRRSLSSDTAAISDADLLVAEDLAGDHADAQMDRGYVSALQAALFLGEAKGTALDDLLIQVTYDQISALHLRRTQRQRDTTGSPAAQNTESRAAAHQPEPATPADADFKALDALLVEAEITTPVNAGLLAAPEGDAGSYLNAALKALGATDTAALAARQDELIFLSNVLLVGSHIQGEAFQRAEAAQAVSATCNLGLTYCVEVEPWDTEQAIVESFLTEPPGLIKAFRIGYHLLGNRSARAVAKLAQQLTGAGLQRRLHAHPWLQERVETLFAHYDRATNPSPDLVQQLPPLFERMSLILNSTTCQQLRLLCDPFPCYARSLDADAESIRVDRSRRFVSTPGDLANIDGFLDGLRL